MIEQQHNACRLYQFAYNEVVASGFGAELKWHSDRHPYDFNESDLLREIAWVVLCSGFRESVVRQKFSTISLCFCDWSSAREIVESAEVCRRTALQVLENRSKIEAIVSAAVIIEISGFDCIREQILLRPIESLRRFDFIGSVTSFHLAKNLGFQVAKPDRHLVRLSHELGFENVNAMCQLVSSTTGHQVNVVDLVFWRYCVLHGGKVPDTACSIS